MLCKTSRWDPTIYTVIGWSGALNYFYSYSDLDKDNNITFNRTLGVLKTPIIVMGGCLNLPLFNFLSIVGKYLSFKTVMVLYKLFWKSGLYQLCTIWWTEINEDFIFVPNDRGGLILIISTYFITTNSFLDQVFLVKFPLKVSSFLKNNRKSRSFENFAKIITWFCFYYEYTFSVQVLWQNIDLWQSHSNFRILEILED